MKTAYRNCVGLAVLLLAAVPYKAKAEAVPQAPRRAAFALIIGVNQSVDSDEQPLRYADDDAARYLDLFRSLGAEAHVMARLDENTSRLHPSVAVEALPPVHASFARLEKTLTADVRAAGSRGDTTVFYFVYAGHGRVRDDAGYLALEDHRLTEAEISALIRSVGASQTHVIVDACHADFLAYGRGPGGTRRPATGFVAMESLTRNDRVGLFLSTSATGESHEWEGFQSGVFSHEVRSGLYGAADIDGDGVVSYRELAAFVARANSGVVNERFRPQVVVRAPREHDGLVDLHPGLAHQIALDESEPSAHHLLEDESGVRLLDFHNGRGQRLTIIRPTGAKALFLRRLDDHKEFALPASPDVVTVASLIPSPEREGTRGAAHVAFSALFSFPFVRDDVDQFLSNELVATRTLDEPLDSGHRSSGRRLAGWAAAGAGVAAAAAGAILLVSAQHLRDGVAPTASPAEVQNTNAGIRTRNNWAIACFGVSAGAAVGAAWLLWPRSTPSGVVPQVSATGAELTWVGRF